MQEKGEGCVTGDAGTTGGQLHHSRVSFLSLLIGDCSHTLKERPYESLVCFVTLMALPHTSKRKFFNPEENSFTTRNDDIATGSF